MKNYSKKIQIVNIALILAVVIGGYAYYVLHNLLVKTVASLLFVILAFINYKRTKPTKFSKTMLWGIIFAMLADVALEINFMAGAAVFAVGHILYFISYCYLEKFRLSDIIPAMVLFLVVAAVILFAPVFDFGGPVMQTVCIIYALIIACMLSKAFINYRRKPSTLTLLLFLGSGLFFFSDFMLLFSKFADVSVIFRALCVNNYYPGQAVLSHALLYTNENNN